MSLVGSFAPIVQPSAGRVSVTRTLGRPANRPAKYATRPIRVEAALPVPRSNLA